MPKITALIHAYDDAERIGRLLDSLRPCDEVLVITHGSDATAKTARDHGAKVKAAVPGVSAGAYLVDAQYEWLLCVRPNEALSEALEAALFEWKGHDAGANVGFSIRIREETVSGWKMCQSETRLVNRNRVNWTDELPPHEPHFQLLRGDLLRFRSP